MQEPSDLELAIVDRIQLNVCPFGPLTLEQHEAVESYEQYMQESYAEHLAEEAAGGRTICQQCGNRSVTHRSVVTLGYAGHPGAEYSDLGSCEECGFVEL
jgi:hypothetical protein